MPLPDLIEIVPLEKPVRAEIAVPGSKSITNRALILAALADGEVTLTGALWSEDTQVMTEALRTLGFDVRVEKDPAEFCNRTITVKGQGGKIPKAGTAEKPLELFVGNAGTAARFLAAMVCLGDGVYRLSGVPRMHERPQAALFQALRELGYRVDAKNNRLPARIYGRSRKRLATSFQWATPVGLEYADSNSCSVSILESSQFASALLLSAKRSGWNINVIGEHAEEAPYIEMTRALVREFPWGGGKIQIEPDASSGSYFVGSKWLLQATEFRLYAENQKTSITQFYHREKFFGSKLNVNNWPKTDWQIDTKFQDIVGVQSLSAVEMPDAIPLTVHFPVSVSRQRDLGDSIMTAIALSPILSFGKVEFTHLGRLRLQECERVVALKTELTKCGVKVTEDGDILTVEAAKPGELHGAEIETYNDHRMAMCFAILGLKVPGIRIKNPSCVKKTFPNFFQKLAAAPPHGLGVEIWEVKDGKRSRKLDGEDLFAD